MKYARRQIIFLDAKTELANKSRIDTATHFNERSLKTGLATVVLQDVTKTLLFI